MTDLQKLKNWLQQYPHWDTNGELLVDYTKGVAGNWGLYVTGLQEKDRTQDIQGNATAENRYTFTLYRLVAAPLKQEAFAEWLLDFQQWVQRESAQGRAPAFGDVPSKERLCAHSGRLESDSKNGVARYALQLTADFVKYY